MPTVILLDKSLSMKRPARTEARTDTRLSLATEGLEFFLSYLERCFPMEYTCLMAFSSSCEVLAPFTRDSKELVEQLGQVTCADRTDLHKALQCVVETVITEWGMFVPCQLVLVTDGRLGLGLGGRQQPVCLPFPCQLHVVCIASEKEVSAYSQLHPSVELAGIKTTSVHVPRSDPLTHNLVLETFSNLVTAYYWPYLGNLKCGHLQSKVCISPSPSMCRSSCDIVVESNQRFSSPLADLDFPSDIIICGFLDLAVISAPAIYSRHFVLDGEFDSEAVTRLIKRLREKTEEEEKSVNKEKPSFRVILHGSLKMESKVAVVMLGEDWYGLLSSALCQSKKSNLVLSVLYPGSEVPWLGSMEYLGPPFTTTNPRMSSGTKGGQLPVSVAHTLSYQSPIQLLWAKELGLQNDIAKVMRYCKKLPDKEQSLVKELNKLRLQALTFSMPSLLEALCQTLSAEEASAGSPLVKNLLQRILQFLSNNHNPQDRLAASHQKTY